MKRENFEKAKASLLFADALIAESEIIKQPLTKH